LCETVTKVCIYNRQSGTTGTCVSTEESLNADLAKKSVITLCENSIITLGNELVVSGGGVTITCAKSHTCTINGGGSFRLMKFVASNIVIEGITFQDGKSSGNVSSSIFLVCLLTLL
jgi:hypothetical protein